MLDNHDPTVEPEDESYDDEEYEEYEHENEGNPDEELREKIRKTAKAIDQHYVALGGQLYDVANRKLYRNWGYPTFNDYLENDVGIGRRRGQRLRQIWKRLIKDFGVDKNLLIGARYSNIMGIMSLVRPKILTKATATDWVMRAKTLTYAALKEDIKAAMALREADENATITPASVEDAEIRTTESNTTRKQFKFTDDELSLVEEALSEAYDGTGSDRPGHLLANICTFFVANRASDEVMKQFLLDKLTAVYGGRFIHLEDEEMIEAWEEAFADVDMDYDDEE